jgi:hypothetical protein
MLAKMVTETAEFRWNTMTQHFESRIFVTNPINGERSLVAFYSTPPHIFLASFAAQAAAISEFEEPRAEAEIVEITQHG